MKTRQKRRGMLWAVLLIVGGLAIGCRGSDPEVGGAREVVAPSAVQEEHTPLQAIRLSPEQARDLDVRTVRVQRTDYRYALRVPGTVHPAPEHISLVSAPISGRVTRIFAHEGEAVRRGQVLLELESLEFARLVADYLQARADETYQDQQVTRLEQLVEKKISPRAALERAQADYYRATAAVQATDAQLRTLGVGDQELERWAGGEAGRPVLRIYAPLSGVINQHRIEMGQAVTAYDELLDIVNLEEVLVRGYISPDEAALVQPGDAVEISMKDFPEQRIAAAVRTISPALDVESKSVTVNVRARTQLGWPLPGQNVRLSISVGLPQPVIVVPLSAVQYEEQDATVFVRRDSLTFEKRPITISRTTDEEVVVASGLEEGEEVAVSQVFSLKALERYEQFAEE